MKKIVLFLLLLSAFITKAQTILLSENFNYPIGSKLTDNGWTAHSGAGTNAQKVADEVLYNSSYSYSGGSYSYSGVGFANALATSGEDVNKKFTAVSSGKVYVSFLLNVSAAQDGGGYFLHLGPSTIDTVFRARVFIRKDAAGFNIGVSKSTANANYATERYVFGKTYNIVVKYTFNNATNTDDEVELFIDQITRDLSGTCADSEPTAKIKALANELDTKVDIGSIAIRQGSATTAPTLRISNITVATDWNSAIRCSGGSTTAVISNLGAFTNLNSSNDDKYRKLSTPSGIPSASTESMFTFGDKVDSLTITMPEGFEATIDYDQKLLKPINFQKSLKLKNTIKLTWYFRLTGEKTGKYEGYVTFSSKNNETVRLKVGGEVIGLKQQSIADIRKLSLNSTATVSGRVVAGDQFGSTLFVQDASAGIAIFSAAMATAVQIGDSVNVTGTLSKFNELLQLSTPNLTFAKIDVPKKIVSPKSINLNETSGYEGQLVNIKDVVFTEKGFVFVPNSNYQIRQTTTVKSARDTTYSGELRIVASTNLIGRTKPQTPTTVTGVMGRFNDVFQLQPRFQEDLPNTLAYTKADLGITADKTLDIVTWNTNWLGNIANGPTNEVLQQTNVKKVLDTLKADLYMLEEVSNLKVFQQLVAGLKDYKGFCSTEVSAGGVADDAQRVCFIYKTTVFDSVSARPLLKKATALPNYPENNPARFWASGRLPLMFVADATIDGVKRRLTFVGLHARANTGGTTATLDAKELQYRQRRYDVEVLKDSLDAQFPNANLIMAGDYNDELDETVSEITSTKESSYKKYVDDAKNYKVVTKALSDIDFRSYLSFSNMIDHITISNELFDSYLDKSVGEELPFLYLQNYITTTSDHAPVFARFKLLEIAFPTELTAKANGTDNIALTWKDNTTNETGFELERSIDGKSFAKIADLVPNATTFTDDKNLEIGKKHSYRMLVKIPSGEKSKFSNLAELNLQPLATEPTENQLVFSVSPNPSTENITIIMGSEFQNIPLTMQFISIDGKMIAEDTQPLKVLNEQLNKQLPQLKSGVYLLKLKAGEKTGVVKILR